MLWRKLLLLFGPQGHRLFCHILVVLLVHLRVLSVG